MKTKYFFISYLLLTIFAMSSMISVQAADYKMDVEEDEEFYWTLNTLDEDLADDYGMDDIEDWVGEDAELGAKFKYTITELDDDKINGTDVFIVEYKFWGWATDEADFDDKEDTKRTAYLAQDPDVYEKNNQYFQWVMPTPLEDYLDEIDWDDDYEIDGKILTRTVEYKDLEGDLLYQYTFNDRGVLESLKAMTEDNEVIYEYALPTIPGYELPILLGITAIFTIGIIYTIVKRKK